MFEFAIAGFQKCGTTSLYEYLKQLDEIKLPRIKEIPYFTDDNLFSDQNYWDFWLSDVVDSESKVRGFAYANLLRFIEKSGPRVLEAYPNIKLICIVREPKDRIVSAYKYAQSRGWEENNSFKEAIELNRNREFNEYYQYANLDYVNNTKYSQFIEEALKYTTIENILLIKFTDLANNPKYVMKSVLSFLNLDVELAEKINYKIYNKQKETRNKLLQKLLLRDNLIKKSYHRIVPVKLRYRINSSITRNIESWNLKENKDDNKKRDSVEERALYNQILEEYSEIFDSEKERLKNLTGTDGF